MPLPKQSAGMAGTRSIRYAFPTGFANGFAKGFTHGSKQINNRYCTYIYIHIYLYTGIYHMLYMYFVYYIYIYISYIWIDSWLIYNWFKLKFVFLLFTVICLYTIMSSKASARSAEALEHGRKSWESAVMSSKLTPRRASLDISSNDSSGAESTRGATQLCRIASREDFEAPMSNCRLE